MDASPSRSQAAEEGTVVEMGHDSTRRSRATALALSVLTVSVLASCGDSGPSPTTSHVPASAPPPPQGPATAPASLPDFAITGYLRDPAEGQLVIPGTKVNFHIKVTNKGSGAYGQFVAVRGPGNYSGGFSGLMPGETKEATVELGVSMPGGGTVRDIYFTVDPDNVAAESNEANNTLGPLMVKYGGG